jgi:hypothetical protein
MGVREGSVAPLTQQPLHLRNERRRLHIQRARELAQRSERGLANSPLDLADEGSVDIGAERERFLRNTGRRSLFSQHSTESC